VIVLSNSDEKNLERSRIEQEFFEKRDKERRETLRKEYLELKNIGFILVDFVPYARKSQMIEGLKRLFSPEGSSQPIFPDEPRIDGIPDIRESGMLSGGGIASIGIIFNSDLGEGFVLGIQRKLPDWIQSVHVFVGQFVDYAYYTVYSCLIKENYQNEGIERVFTESEDWVPYQEKTLSGKEIRGRKPKGPQLEPTIRNYQESMEKYLRPFSCGYYLNSDNMCAVSCPNLKILCVPKVDFTSFDQWEKNYLRLLNFIGFNFTYSKFEQMLAGYYRKSLLTEKPSSVFEGLVFLASLTDFKGDGYGKPEIEIFDHVESYVAYGMARLLHIIYWPAYNIEVTQKEWKKKNTNLLATIRDLRIRKNPKLNDVYKSVLESYGGYNQYYLDEIENIRTVTEELKRMAIHIAKTDPLAGSLKFNVFGDLFVGGKRFLSREKDNLDALKKEIDDLFRHCSDFVNMGLNETNLSLQRSMNRMTIVMLLLTFVTVAVPLIQYGPTLWSWWQGIHRPILPFL
jgi:hypothetical protein